MTAKTTKAKTAKPKADKASVQGQTTATAHVTDAAKPADEPTPEARRAAAAAAAQALYESRRDSDEEQDENEERVTLAMAKVLITRDNTKTDKDVFAHEVEILQLIHGESNVEVYGNYDVEVINFDPQTELDRLYRFYGKNGEEAVGAIYGRDPRKVAQATGTSLGEVDRHRNKMSEQAMAVDHSVSGGVDSGRIKVAQIVPKKSGKR